MSQEATDARNKGENPTNRAVVADDNFIDSPASLSSLNNDCLAFILSYFTLDELNETIVVISKQFCGIRNHESLNQKRTATIACSRAKGSSCQSLCVALDKASLALHNHNTHLKIVGLETVQDGPFDPLLPPRTVPRVTTLELEASNPNEHSENAPIPREVSALLPYCFPLVKEVLLNGVQVIDFGRRCLEHLSHVVARGCLVTIEGHEFRAQCRLNNLTLESCCFYKSLHIDDIDTLDALMRYGLVENVFSDESGPASILSRCPQLQRLNIKGATWKLIVPPLSSPTKPVPQAMLIKMVRYLPNLVWLRSDLSAENVKMMQQERPEITFVSD